MISLPLRRLVVCIALFAVACAATEVKDSWRNPEVGPIRFKKVVVLAITNDAALRRTIEDQLTKQGARAEVVAAYTFIPDGDLGDTEKLKRLVSEAGFDGAVVFRIAGTQKQQTYVPGSYAMPSYGLWGYYGNAWSVMSSPGYVVTDTYVEVETRVYSVADEKLVWAGRSETLNPPSIRELVDDVAKAVAKELRAQGLIE
jgi:hypothetical protein